ncbi:cytochrome P450, partial [Lyophyllum atratum]
PTLQDYEQLPNIQACVRETTRWRPLTPTGVPHRPREDDVYEGYSIPKDTICIPNTWALDHDTDVHGPDAEECRPERHLDARGQLLPSVPDSTMEEGHVTYGFGSRICVGRAVSDRSLLIQMASMLRACKFSMGKGEDKKPFVADTLTNGGLDSSRPMPFPCVVTPRSAETKSMVAQ